MGGKDPYHAYKEKLNELQITKHRKNGVRALELVLAFSPNFLKDDAGRYREDARERAKWWEAETVAWLKKTFGERCVSAWRHADESSIHIHAMVVPFEQKVRKNGKIEWGLNARGITGGAEKLSQLQDSYAAATEKYLIRGKRNSKIKHTSLKEFYGAIQQSRAECEALEIDAPEPHPEKLNAWRATLTNIIETLKAAKRDDTEKLEFLVAELVKTNESLKQRLAVYECRSAYQRHL